MCPFSRETNNSDGVRLHHNSRNKVRSVGIFVLFDMCVHTLIFHTYLGLLCTLRLSTKLSYNYIFDREREHWNFAKTERINAAMSSRRQLIRGTVLPSGGLRGSTVVFGSIAEYRWQ